MLFRQTYLLICQLGLLLSFYYIVASVRGFRFIPPHPPHPLLAQVSCYNLDWLELTIKTTLDSKLGHLSDFPRCLDYKTWDHVSN